MRQDIKRTKINRVVRDAYKEAVKMARKKKDTSSLQRAYQALDVAAKKAIIHPNKAARLKSRLAKQKGKTPGKPKTPKERSSTKKRVSKSDA